MAANLLDFFLLKQKTADIAFEKSIFTIRLILLEIDVSCPFFPLQKIDYDSPRGGVSVVIEKGKWTTSHLLIQRATSKDSGIYKCAPLNAVSASINLHVLRGKIE